MNCKFCNATFKTEKGFKNHSCIKLRRYKLRKNKINLPETNIALQLWIAFLKFNSMIQQFKEPNAYFIISKDYNKFVKFAKYIAIENQCPNHMKYLSYLMTGKIPYKKWLDEKLYEDWLFNFIMTESYSTAIKRSEKNVSLWEADNKKSIKDMSAGHLSLMVGNGKISPWYVYSTELKSVIQKNSIVDIVDNRNTSKLLNKDYWLLKLKSLDDKNRKSINTDTNKEI